MPHVIVKLWPGTSERQKAQGQSQGGLLGAIGSAAQSLFDAHIFLQPGWIGVI